jgi:hypothetical protein
VKGSERQHTGGRAGRDRGHAHELRARTRGRARGGTRADELCARASERRGRAPTSRGPRAAATAATAAAMEDGWPACETTYDTSGAEEGICGPSCSASGAEEVLTSASDDAEGRAEEGAAQTSGSAEGGAEEGAARVAATEATAPALVLRGATAEAGGGCTWDMKAGVCGHAAGGGCGLRDPSGGGRTRACARRGHGRGWRQLRLGRPRRAVTWRGRLEPRRWRESLRLQSRKAGEGTRRGEEAAPAAGGQPWQRRRERERRGK